MTAEYCNLGPCAALDGHDGNCAEASGWITTCDDLGCVEGQTIQGRKYHYDGTVEEQWAPCGRYANNCPGKKWAAFPGRVPVCQDCGTDWKPVRRGECVKCGSDAGPLRGSR